MDVPSPEETETVLRTYLVGERLTVMPRRGRKRRIVLEQIAQRFEPGLRFVEREVNDVLEPVWPDVASLRRYLVDEGLLDRTPDGVYWRSGGPVYV